MSMQPMIHILRAAALSLGLSFSVLATAGPVVKAEACMFEIQAEAYRFARVHRELAAMSASDPAVRKLKQQSKAATQELFQNLHEAKPGLDKIGLGSRHDRLNDLMSDFVSEAVSSAGDKSFASLIAKQKALLQAAEDTKQQIAQKSKLPAITNLSHIGEAKVAVERLSYLYEFCDKDCAQSLPEAMGALDRRMDTLNSQLGAYIKKSNVELATNQLIFLRLAVSRRNRTPAVDDATARAHVIVASQHLWEIIDETLDAYIDKAAE